MCQDMSQKGEVDDGDEGDDDEDGEEGEDGEDCDDNDDNEDDEDDEDGDDGEVFLRFDGSKLRRCASMRDGRFIVVQPFENLSTRLIAPAARSQSVTSSFSWRLP